MSERCEGCAFTKDSVANQEPDNHIKGILCLLTPQTFYCHDKIDWKNPDNHGRISLEKLREMKPNICQGWKEEVRELANTGYYKENSEATKVYGESALNVLDVILKEKDQSIKNVLWRDFGSLLKSLSKKWKKFRNKSIEVQF